MLITAHWSGKNKTTTVICKASSGKCGQHGWRNVKVQLKGGSNAGATMATNIELVMKLLNNKGKNKFGERQIGKGNSIQRNKKFNWLLLKHLYGKKKVSQKLYTFQK